MLAENPPGELVGVLVGHGEHFIFGIEVVDMMQGKSLRSCRQSGGTEFPGPVVAGDEVEKVEANQVAGRLQGRPCRGLAGIQSFSPELVNHFDPEGDMPHHFSVEGEGLGEACFRVVVLPEFSAVMEENACNEKIFVEVGIGATDCGGSSHHLGHVLHQSSSSGMVVAPGSCGPAEAIAEFGKEYAGEGSQTGVLKSRTGIQDMIPVGVLFAGRCGVAPEKLLDFALFKRS